MKYQIQWDERALHEMEKLDRFISERILKKVEDLAENIDFLNVKRLKGENRSRLRVGDYRVIFSTEKDSIIIWKVGHRKNIYN